MMHYELIVNHPFTCTANVLAATLNFAHAWDPGLRRLEEHWSLTPGGVALHDSFNREAIPMGRDAAGNEYDPDDSSHCFTDGYGNYRILDTLTRGQLDDLLDVFNHYYGNDCFIVMKTPIGYGYYKCVND